MITSLASVFYFLGILVIAIGFLFAIGLFADCAWCAWRDRRHAHHH
jgi:hypothetical protein